MLGIAKRVNWLMTVVALALGGPLGAAPPDPKLLLPGPEIGPLRPGSVLVEDGATALDQRGQLLVGMPGGYTGQTGAVYLHRWQDGQWQVRQIILAPEAHRQSGARFGQALAVQGRWLLVGAPQENVDGLAQAGAGYLFRRRDEDDRYVLIFNGRIVQQGVSGTGRRLGSAVAIGEDFAALGVPGHSPAGAPQAGQVLWLARQPNDAWLPSGTLSLPAGHPSAGAAFGATLTMNASGDQLFVAAPDQTVDGQAVAGRVYWFRWVNEAWNLRQQLSWTPTDLLDRFGASMALHGNYLFVGASARSKPGSSQSKGGGVRVYRRDTLMNLYVVLDELFPNVAQSGARFGQSLSVLGTPAGPRLLVGAPRRNLGNTLIGVRSEAGEALLFEPDWAGTSHVWTQGAVLYWRGSILASASGNHFGSAVQLGNRPEGPVAFVSAPGRSADAGSTAGWVQAFVGDRVFAQGFQAN